MIKLVDFLKEGPEQYNIGDIYKGAGGTEYKVTPTPDKYKSAYGVDNYNVWVTDMSNNKQHFVPISILKNYKKVEGSISEGSEQTYTYKLDPKTKKYDVLKVKGGTKVTSFDTEDKAKQHVDKINKLDSGYASIKGKVHEDEDVSISEGSEQIYTIEITAKNGKKTTSKVPASSPVELNGIVAALKKSKNVASVKVLKVEGSISKA